MTNKKPEIINDILESIIPSTKSPAQDASTISPTGSDYNTWYIKPDSYINEDVLSDESIQEETPNAIMRNLLQPNEQLKTRIGEYIKAKNFQNCAHESINIVNLKPLFTKIRNMFWMMKLRYRKSTV